MAQKDSEKTPLLAEENGDNCHFLRHRHNVHATVTADKNVVLTDIGNHNRNATTDIEGTCDYGPSSSNFQFSESDHIVSVFVVAFDTKAGN